MIEKQAEYISSEVDYELFTLLEGKDSSEMVKQASYAFPIQQYIESLKQENNYLYALINALTAGEYYGPNRNGDYFPEQALRDYHHTFVENGYVYKHHVNKDPKKSLGKVLFSHYNDDMKRVELVVQLKKDHPDVLKIVKDIMDGKIIKTSMGTRVPFDVCSITNQKAKTRSEYSDYLKNRMNQVLPDGRRVYAINTQPKFFDISIVTIPADPVSSFMKTFGLEKMAHLKESEDKQADIKKQIQGTLEGFAEDPKELLLATQQRLTQEQIEKLSEYPLNETLSTFIALRIAPLKEDFQKLALYHAGYKQWADWLDKKGVLFESPKKIEDSEIEKVGSDWVNKEIADVLKEDILELSLTKPNIINRIIKHASLQDVPAKVHPQERERSFLKRMLFDEPEIRPEYSGVKNPLVPLTALGTLYAGFAQLYSSTATEPAYRKIIQQHPWLGPLIGGGIAIGLKEMQENILSQNSSIKTAAISPTMGAMLLSFPLSYYTAAKAEAKVRRGEPIDNLEDTVRKHPFPSALVGGFAGGAMLKGIGKSFNFTGKAGKAVKNGKSPRYSKNFWTKTGEYLTNLNTETINIIYKELTS